MTATHLQRLEAMKTNSASDLMNLKNAVLMEFCTISGSATPKEIHLHDIKRGHVQNYCDEFIDRMLSAKPYESREAAIKSLAPSSLFQFGRGSRQLAVDVVGSLWRRWNG